MFQGLAVFSVKLSVGICICLLVQSVVKKYFNLSSWGSFRVVASVLHLIMAINAIPEFVDIWFRPHPMWELTPSERLFTTVPRFSTLNYIIVLYEIYLIIAEIMEDKFELQYVVHHAVTLTLISITVTQTYAQYALPFLMGIIFVSSFFLDLRDPEIPKSAKFKELVDVAFSVSFYGIRIFLWTYVIVVHAQIHSLWAELWPESFFSIPEIGKKLEGRKVILRQKPTSILEEEDIMIISRVGNSSEEVEEFLNSEDDFELLKEHSTAELKSFLSKHKLYLIPTFISLFVFQPDFTASFLVSFQPKVLIFAILFWALALSRIGGEGNGNIQLTCLKRVCVFMIFKFGYECVRSGVKGDYDLALKNADHIVYFERSLHLFFEHGMQAFFLAFKPIILFSNFYYETQHFIQVCIACLLNIIYVESSGFSNEIAFHLLNVSALVVFFNFPTSPPRLWTSDPNISFLDTKDPGSVYSKNFEQEGNPFAAVPSMHCAWALWSAFVEIDITRGWKYDKYVQAWGVFHVVFTAFVTMVTGNHWWTDAVVGWTLCSFALLCRWKVQELLSSVLSVCTECWSFTPFSCLPSLEDFFNSEEEVELTERRSL